MNQHTLSSTSRLHSRSVIRTTRSAAPLHHDLKEGDAPNPQKDLEREDEIQAMLRKQRAVDFDSSASIADRFVSSANFSIVSSPSDRATGAMSLEIFQETGRYHKIRSRLRLGGFTEAQIERKIRELGGPSSSDHTKRFGIDPTIERKESEWMDEYLGLKRAKTLLETHDAETIEINISSTQLSQDHVKESAIKQEPIQQNEGDELPEVIHPVSRDLLRQMQMSEEDFAATKVGAAYCTGDPSHILYIKNIATETKRAELVAIFLSFQTDDDRPLVFKYMTTGKMKGQAFVTFPDVESATLALSFVHRVVLHGKCLSVQFGRGKGNSSAAT